MKEVQTAMQVLERSTSLPPAGIIFDGKPVIRVLVPSEVRRAGALAKQVRARHQLSLERLLLTSSMSTATFNAFEKLEANVELEKVYTDMSVHLDEQDSGIVEIGKLRNNQQWFRTVAQANMSLGDCIERMCLASWSIPMHFAKKAGIAQTQRGYMDYYVTDAIRPSEDILNDLISASVIDSDSKAAKLIRLKRERRKPKRLSEFRVSELPTDLKDLRLMLGLSTEALGKKIYYTGRSILIFESGERKISKEILRAYADGLQLPEDSPLLWSLFFKLNNPNMPLPAQVLPLVFDEERLLFHEHLGQILPYPKSPVDRKLLSELKSKRSIAAKMVHVRAKHKIPAKTSSRRIRFDHVPVDGRITEGIKIMELMKLTGRDLHNPVSDHLLRTAKQERQHRYKGHGAKRT